MMYACIQNCSVCPFRCKPHRPVQSPTVTTPEPVKEDDVSEESITENGLSVIETIPAYEVKRNIFGKEKVVKKV